MKKILLLILFASILSYGLSNSFRSIYSNEAINDSRKNENKAKANSILFNLNFSEDFEDPVGWSFINGTEPNKWHIGTAAFTGSESTQSLYISNDEGVSNTYSIESSSRVFAYKTITIPLETAEISVSFDWRCLAESGSWDYMRVWITNETFVPVTTSEITALANERIQVGGNFNGNGQWSLYSGIINVSGLAGQDAKLIIEWRNDDGWGNNPPAAIDNIEIAPILCSAPQNISSEDLTETSATLTWEPSGASNTSSYEYYLSSSNTAPDSSTAATGSTTSTSTELEELTAGSSYYFWVRTICTDEDGASVWSGPYILSLPASNNDCENAMIAIINTDATCTELNSSTLFGATLTDGLDTNSCGNWSNAVKDVWFEFTATETAYEISLLNADSPWDMYIQLYNDDICTSSDNAAINCNTNTMLASNLNIGDSYKIRIFSTSTSNNSSFDLCIRTLMSPENNDCEDALVAPVNIDGLCTQLAPGTFQDATLSFSDVTGCPVTNPAKDIWYEFTATETSHLISILDTFSTWNMYIQLFNDSICTTTENAIACSTTPMIASSLVPGNTYKVRIFTTSPTNNESFNVCIRTLNPPDNDECNDAVTVPVNEGEECIESVDGTLLDATISDQGGEGCNWSSPVKDVWYEFTATSTDHAIIISEPDFQSFSIHVEVYENDICDTESDAIMCSTNPEAILDNLTIGNTYKVRVFSSSVTNNQDFNICIITLQPKIITNDTQYTIPELVSDILIDNDCAEISNVTWSTGTNYNDVNGIGYFEKNNSVFPFENGIVLTTGDVNFAPGPAAQGTSYGFSSWLGDTQLTTYMNDYLNEPNQGYFNASVLEFDFMAVTDSLKFNFLFASNEYGQYQCDFSDAFAFFLTNTETNEVTNLAIVPNTTDPISVVTIRKEIHSPLNWATNEPNCEDANPEYFNELYHPDNIYNGLPPISSPINFYGSTIPMVAESAVVPGTVYHIKLVIQDRGDSSMDSAVFIEGGSFDLGTVDLGEDFLVETGTALCEGDNVLLDTGLSTDVYSIEWFKDGEIIPGQNGSTLEATESGTYKVEATFIGSICAITNSVIIEIFPPIELVQPENIEICLQLGQIPPVDLTIYEELILSEMEDQTDLMISYHNSIEEAEEGINPIASPQNFTPQQPNTNIYVRVENNISECYEITSFQIIQKPIDVFISPSDIETCVYYNQIDAVDLTLTEESIRSQSNSELLISYHLTEQDSETLSSPISNPTDFVPSTLPATIYVGIVNTETQCQALTSFNIVESERITPMEQEDITSCTKYELSVLPDGYYYSTEEFGQGVVLQTGHIYELGEHKVFININNDHGCVFSSSFNIKVIECNIQKGISPNGDGLNDHFDLTFYFPKEVRIFNRHGKEVYLHGSGYTNEWVGQDKNGNPLPEGTYFYRIITDFEEFTGYIYLSREIK